MLSWLGVADTGSDTASNELFGGLQNVIARQLNLNPMLIATASSSGGVMGKMIDAQSIVVASTMSRVTSVAAELSFGHPRRSQRLPMSRQRSCWPAASSITSYADRPCLPCAGCGPSRHSGGRASPTQPRQKWTIAALTGKLFDLPPQNCCAPAQRQSWVRLDAAQPSSRRPLCSRHLPMRQTL
jgi:L-lactate permease